MPRIAIFDDYQNVALKLADWSEVTEKATVTVFNDHLSDANDIVDRLREFDAVCVMRERTPLTRDILERSSRLKLIASTGRRNASIDVEAAAEFGIEVLHTNYDSSSTIELTWALILATARNLTTETDSVRSGGWQRTVGDGIRGKVLGVLGLGNVGSQVARIAGAFGMEVMAWSENLTQEKAAAAGARLVSKGELFEQADILTIHLVLSSRTRGLVCACPLG